MSKEELERLIRKTDKDNQRNKQKRAILGCLFFAIMYVILFWERDAAALSQLTEAIILGLIAGVVHYVINAVVFSLIINASVEEDARLQSLIKMYEEKYGESVYL